MSDLQIDLSNIRFAIFEQVFSNIEATLKKFNIDFYVIGALARDMQFSTDNIATRTTADIDLAIYINGSEASYQEIKAYLVNKYSFTESSENAFTVISEDGHTIDLLPFGAIEVEDGVSIAGKGLTNIKVNGFKEVFRRGLIKIETTDGTSFSVASLASILLLKLIAWDDRPERRVNDPGDVASIIKNYFSLNADTIYEYHNDLFRDNDGGEDYQLEDVSGQVIGREINKIVGQTPALKARTISILESLIKKAELSSFNRSMVGNYCKSIDIAVIWLSFMLKGINEKKE